MHFHPLPLATLASLLLFFQLHAQAQISEEEHKKHHPPTTSDTAAPGSAGGMMGPEMSKMMDEMMKKMGLPKQRELYPSLINLPSLTEKERSVLEKDAHQRMKQGASLIENSLQRLTRESSGDNFRAMKQSLDSMKEGVAQFESGVNTHIALREGKAPKEIALAWYKDNLGLHSPEESSRFSFFGLSSFHFFTMVLLILFSVVMIIMYFFKTRRALSLIQSMNLNGRSQPIHTAGEDSLPIPSVNSHTQAGATPGIPPKEKNVVTPHHEVHEGHIGATVVSQELNSDSVSLKTNWKGRLRLDRIIIETPTIKTFRFVPIDQVQLPFSYKAGQFLTLGLTIDGKPVKRSYTIASHPCDKKAVELTIKREEKGLVSCYLHDTMKVGDAVDVEAAFGNLTLSGTEAESIVLIGGGVGITPLMSVLRCLVSCGYKKNIYLIYACRAVSEFLFREELELLQKRYSNLCVLPIISDAQNTTWLGVRGRITKSLISDTVPEIMTSRIHLCGPLPMMTAVKEMLAELGVAQEHVKTEGFGTPKPVPKTQTYPHPAVQVDSDRTISFSRSKKTIAFTENETVLDAAERAGVDIPFSCRVGTCGSCKVKLVHGNVEMSIDDGLTTEDKRENIILACQAHPKGAIEVDA